jgi:hypothetical protein
MEENLFKLNESFRFDISISDRCYDHKPTSEDYKSMSFHVENLNADELIDRIKSGHSICHVFNDNRRTKKNFMYTSAVFIDVDDSPQSMKVFLEGCQLKPSIAYTTFSDGKNGSYRFRLIYLFDEQISSTDEYKCIYYHLISMINLEQTKDNCGSVTAQLMNGNSNNNIRVFRSNYVLDKLSFLQNCHLELYIPHPLQQYISNRQFCKNETDTTTMMPEDLVIIEDLNEYVDGFI